MSAGLLAALVLVTLAALVGLLTPLLRRGRGAQSQAQYDRAVYLDQLAEIDRDLARGLLQQSEAESARLEIQRRLLAAPESAPAPQARARPRLALAIAAMLAAAAAIGYAVLGSPGVPDLPFAARTGGAEFAGATPAGHENLASAAEHLAEKLKREGGDSAAWTMLARTYATMSRWEEAAEAYRHALDKAEEADRADIEAAYGEMLTLAAQGTVTPTAADAFAAAIAHDPNSQVARYYLALADAQAGRTAKAIDAWLALAKEVPADSALHAGIERNVSAAAKAAGIAVPALPTVAPEAADENKGGQAQAQSEARSDAPTPPAGMNAADQKAMIETMVAGLAAKLQANPDDFDGWMRLGRSYLVLGKPDAAADAYDHAAKLKPTDVDVPLTEIDQLLQGKQADAQLPPRVLALLDRVKAMGTDRPEALWWLGAAAAQRHRLDEARDYWQRLLKALPEGSDEHSFVAAALKAIADK